MRCCGSTTDGDTRMDGNCDQYDLLVSTYFDGESKGAEARLVEAHLETCSDCRGNLAAYNSIRRGMIAVSTHTRTRRSLAKDIIAALDQDDDPMPC